MVESSRMLLFNFQGDSRPLNNFCHCQPLSLACLLHASDVMQIPSKDLKAMGRVWLERCGNRGMLEVAHSL